MDIEIQEGPELKTRRITPTRYDAKEAPAAFNPPGLLLDHISLYGVPKRERYSVEEMKALTISAWTKLPLNWLSFESQKL